jgi:Domain of unknown function (DUF4158)
VTGSESMHDWRAQYLGLATFPANLTSGEIDELFTFDDDMGRVVAARRKPLTRLGLVLQIGFLRLTGRSLNSVQMIPTAVLQRASLAAGIAAPQLASIRSIYRRRMTLYQHQQPAMSTLGFKDYSEACERALTGHLRRIATQDFDSAILIRQANAWLFSHHWAIPGHSRIEDRVAAAQAHVIKYIRNEMIQGTGRQCVKCWVQLLSATHDEASGETLFEWLRKPVAGTIQTNIAEVGLRLDALRNLGADRLSRPNMAEQGTMQTLSAARSPCSPMSCWPGILPRYSTKSKPTLTSHLTHNAPVAHRHINMKGIMRFAIEPHHQLVRSTTTKVRKAAPHENSAT